jgi:hypothetical protein
MRRGLADKLRAAAGDRVKSHGQARLMAITRYEEGLLTLADVATQR